MEQQKNIPLFKVFMSDDVMEPVTSVLKSGFLTEGPQVEKFERALKDYIGVENLLTINSATSGLTLALRLLIEKDEKTEWPGFDKENDIVLTPALTCFATNASILANNCNIEWIDTDNTSANVSIKDICAKLNRHTKVVYIVHWGGYPVDLNALKNLQDLHIKNMVIGS